MRLTRRKMRARRENVSPSCSNAREPTSFFRSYAQAFLSYIDMTSSLRKRAAEADVGKVRVWVRKLSRIDAKAMADVGITKVGAAANDAL